MLSTSETQDFALMGMSSLTAHCSGFDLVIKAH